jgi:predicted nucleic acid-binding protein
LISTENNKYSIEADAEDILTGYIDQNFIYRGAVNFVIRKKQKITKALCFDKHFMPVGFVKFFGNKEGLLRIFGLILF